MTRRRRLTSGIAWFGVCAALTSSCSDGDRVVERTQLTDSPDAATLVDAAADAGTTAQDAAIDTTMGNGGTSGSDGGLGGTGAGPVDGGSAPTPSTPPLLAIESNDGLFVARFTPELTVHQISSGNVNDPVWSPNGRAIAWHLHTKVVITDVTDLEATLRQDLQTFPTPVVWAPAWSTDSRQLAYVAGERLQVVDTAQWPPVETTSVLLEDREGASQVTWAPMRDALVLSNTIRNGHPVRTFLLADLSGGPPQVRDLGLIQQHAFSIDGDWFLYRTAEEPTALQGISLAENVLANSVEIMLDEPGAKITSFAPVTGGVVIGAVDDNRGGLVRFKSLDNLGAPDLDLNPDNTDFPAGLPNDGGTPVNSQVFVQSWADGAVASFSYQDHIVQLGPFFQAFDGRAPAFEAYLAQELTIFSWNNAPLIAVSPDGHHAVDLIDDVQREHGIWQHSSRDLPLGGDFKTRPIYSPDSRYLLVRDDAAEDYKVFEVDSGVLRTLHSATLDAGTFRHDVAAWAPYGAYLALADAFTGVVEFFDMDDPTASPITIPSPIPDLNHLAERRINLEWQGTRRDRSRWGP